jgi:hypothetical protein
MGALKPPAITAKFLAHDLSQKAIISGALTEVSQNFGTGTVCFVDPFGTPGFQISTAYADGPKVSPEGFALFASSFAEAGLMDRASFFINARLGTEDYTSNARCLLSALTRAQVNVVSDDPMNFINGLFTGAGQYKPPASGAVLQLTTCKTLILYLHPNAASAVFIKKAAETIGRSPILSRMPTIFVNQFGLDMYGPAIKKPMECEQVHGLGAAKRDDQIFKCGKPLLDFATQQTGLPSVAFSDAFYAFDTADKLTSLFWISSTPSAKVFVNRESFMRYLNPDFPVAYVSSVVQPGSPEVKGPAARFIIGGTVPPAPFNPQVMSAAETTGAAPVADAAAAPQQRAAAAPNTAPPATAAAANPNPAATNPQAAGVAPPPGAAAR